MISLGGEALTAVIVIAAILLLFAALCLIPLSLEVSSDEGEFSLKLNIGRFTLLPKSKSKKPSKPTAEKNRRPAESKRSPVDKIKNLGLSLSEWLDVLKAVFSSLKKIGSAVNVPVLDLALVFYDPDPYKTVMSYNYANAALYTIAPYAEKVLKIKEKNIDLSTDFDSGKTKFRLYTRLRIRIGSLLIAALSALISVAAVLIKHKIKERKAQKWRTNSAN